MKDEEVVKELFKMRDAWRYADENKSLKLYPLPMVALLDALEREMTRNGDITCQDFLDYNLDRLEY